MNRISLAAIKYDGYIYVGLCHAYIRDFIVEFLGEEFDRLNFIKTSIQGFVDTYGNFLDREESLIIARSSGQVDKLIGCCLTSEDLWW